jgi:carbon starvation protein
MFFAAPHMTAVPAFTAFSVKGSLMFPILFVTVACGAISGFHSLVGSGTSSKMVDKEEDAKVIGYGGMLIEGVLAVIALIAIGAVGMQEGGAIPTFSIGVGTFMSKIGIPMSVGVPFVALAISAFALTSLDTATRLARFIFQEFFNEAADKEKSKLASTLSNMYVATAISVVIGGMVGFTDWRVIWPIFGSANQLLSALALLAIAAWLAQTGKDNRMVKIPMIFMFLVTLSALIILAKNNIQSGNYLLVFFAVVLFVLAIVLIKESYQVLFGKKEQLVQEPA